MGENEKQVPDAWLTYDVKANEDGPKSCPILLELPGHIVYV